MSQSARLGGIGAVLVAVLALTGCSTVPPGIPTQIAEVVDANGGVLYDVTVWGDPVGDTVAEVTVAKSGLGVTYGVPDGEQLRLSSSRPALRAVSPSSFPMTEVMAASEDMLDCTPAAEPPTITAAVAPSGAVIMGAGCGILGHPTVQTINGAPVRSFTNAFAQDYMEVFFTESRALMGENVVSLLFTNNRGADPESYVQSAPLDLPDGECSASAFRQGDLNRALGGGWDVNTFACSEATDSPRFRMTDDLAAMISAAIDEGMTQLGLRSLAGLDKVFVNYQDSAGAITAWLMPANDSEGVKIPLDIPFDSP